MIQRTALVLTLLAILPGLALPVGALTPHTPKVTPVFIKGCVPTLSSTQFSAPCEDWILTQRDIDVLDVLMSPDGKHAYLVLAGGNDENEVLIKSYAANSGELEWSTSYAENAPGVSAAVVSPDGTRLYVAGMGFFGHGRVERAYILTLDAASGSILRTTKWDYDSSPRAVATSSDGSRLFVTGHSRNNYATAAYDTKTGQELWMSTYDNHGGRSDMAWPSYDVGLRLALTPDNSRVFVTGLSANQAGILETATIALNATTGVQAWTRREVAPLDATGTARAQTFAIAVPHDGRHVLALGTLGLKAYDVATGADVWTNPAVACPIRTAASGAPGECVLNVSPDGSRAFVRTPDEVAAHDANLGGLLWIFMTHPPIRNGIGPDYAARRGDMTTSPDGSRVYVTGPAGKDPYATDTMDYNDNYETFALDANTGLPIWRVVYDHAFDRPFAIAASMDRVIVTGEADPTIGTYNEVVTVAYRANLSQ